MNSMLQILLCIVCSIAFAGEDLFLNVYSPARYDRTCLQELPSFESREDVELTSLISENLKGAHLSDIDPFFDQKGVVGGDLMSSGVWQPRDNRGCHTSLYTCDVVTRDAHKSTKFSVQTIFTCAPSSNYFILMLVPSAKKDTF